MSLSPGVDFGQTYETGLTYAGSAIYEMVMNSPSTRDELLDDSFEIQPMAAHESAVLLDGVPTSTWTYGCSATSAGMIFGYYDRHGYSNMYAGPANGGVAPLTNLGQGIGAPIAGACSIIATQNGFDGRTTPGHVNDYWVSYGCAGPDPYQGVRTEHTWGQCTADYMGTNQWKWDYDLNGSRDSNSDGGTSLFMPFPGTGPLVNYNPPSYYGSPRTELCRGMRLFAESRGYTVLTNFTELTTNVDSTGFSFADYRAEIDAGRPVMIQVTGHSMVGVGYDVVGNWVALHDTWDNSVHWMTWGGSYSGMQMQAVTVIRLTPISSGPVDPSVTSSIGLYASGTWYLDVDGNETWNVPPDSASWFGGQAGATPVAGDWDGNGVTEYAVYDRGRWYFDINGSRTWDAADYGSVSWFGGQSGAQALAGDWNGDGRDEIAIYDNGRWYFDINGNRTWDAGDYSSWFGGQSGAHAVAGDWNGDGSDEIAIYQSGQWYFDVNGNRTWDAGDYSSWFGGQSGAHAVAGDWNGDGDDEIAIYDYGRWYFDINGNRTWDSTDASVASWFGGQNGARPVAGQWQASGSPLSAASMGSAVVTDAAPLTDDRLSPIVESALAHWAAAGLPAAFADTFAKVRYVIADLPDRQLGFAQDAIIYLDRDAAGHGWFIDVTPEQDEEFSFSTSSSRRALDGRALDHIDLLTVVEHELGHVFGLADHDSRCQDLMGGVLTPGTRRAASHAEVDAVFAQYA